MNMFLALDLELFETGDLVPTPLFAATPIGMIRVLEAGQRLTARNIAAWCTDYGYVLIPAHLCSAFGDYAENQLELGHGRLLSGLIVARLSELAFGAITAPSLDSIERVARRMVNLPDASLASVLQSGTFARALPWVQSHAGCATLMTVLIRTKGTCSSKVSGLVFAALIHDLDRLVRPKARSSVSTSECSITMSILARYHPVEAHVHEVLTHYRERVDGSGGPFGYTGNQISEFAQYLGVFSWLCGDGIVDFSNFVDRLKGQGAPYGQAFDAACVELVVELLESLQRF
jgi:hypothetical protein